MFHSSSYSFTVEVKNVSTFKMLKEGREEDYYLLTPLKKAEILVTGSCELEFTFIKLISESDLRMRGIYFISMIVDNRAKKTYQIPFERSAREIKGKENIYLSEPRAVSITLEEGEHRIVLELGTPFEGMGVIFSVKGRKIELKLPPPSKTEGEKTYDVRRRLFLAGIYGNYTKGIGDSYISAPSGGVEFGACPVQADGRFCVTGRFELLTEREREERGAYTARHRLDIYRMVFLLYYRELLGDLFIFEIFGGGGFYPAVFRYSYEPPLNEGGGGTFSAWAAGGGAGIGIALGPGEGSIQFSAFSSRMIKNKTVEGDFLGTLTIGGGYRFRW